MKLPNFSNMMYIGKIRYVQATYEVPMHRGPDFLAREFLSNSELWDSRIRATLALNRLRSNPFYYYVLARTRYYDTLFASVAGAGFSSIMNIGCGSDTRAYRFGDLLRNAQVECFECDQQGAIESKEKLARGLVDSSHVKYMPIDMNNNDHRYVKRWLEERKGKKVLVMMEGVSPYLNPKSFEGFLEMLGSCMTPGSRFAYDFKIKGIKDDFGRSQSVDAPFRLSHQETVTRQFHERLGLSMDHFEIGSDMVKRMLPSLRAAPLSSLFLEDALLQVSV